MPEPLIQLRDVSYSFDNHLAVKDVNLSLERGDFMALIGPNGGGKTTLIKLMMGMFEPDVGEIIFDGGKKAPRDLSLGYVPQNTNVNMTFPITVMEVALMGRLKSAGRSFRYSKENRRIAADALEKVGMADYRDHHMDELSGGQRQRVMIARALASEPEVLFLDEPTSGVDREWHAHIYELLNEINERATIVVSTHDLSVLSSYVKSVACVNQTVFHHESSEFTEEMVDQMYQCPVELIAHGVPHRVLKDH